MCNNIRESSERKEWQREGREQHLVSFSSTLSSFYLGSRYFKTSVSGMPSENKTIVSSVAICMCVSSCACTGAHSNVQMLSVIYFVDPWLLNLKYYLYPKSWTLCDTLQGCIMQWCSYKCWICWIYSYNSTSRINIDSLFNHNSFCCPPYSHSIEMFLLHMFQCLFYILCSNYTHADTLSYRLPLLPSAPLQI